MTQLNLPQEEVDAIKSILIQYRNDGVANPLLPTDIDANNDGIADSFGLDANDEVVLVPGVKLDDTVYVSEEDDFDSVEVGTPNFEESDPE